MSVLFEHRPAGDVVREYLDEVTRMIETVKVGVLAHIDYPARYWPHDACRYDPEEFEVEYRRALSALAQTQGALEINTRLPLDPRIVGWWIEEGGRAVTFGSDSHAPDAVAAGLGEAARIAAGLGFEPSAHLADRARRCSPRGGDRSVARTTCGRTAGRWSNVRRTRAAPRARSGS